MVKNNQYRLDDDAVALLTAYKGASVNLSEAVRNMEKKIVSLQTVIAFTDTKVTHPTQNSVTPVILADTEWTHLEALLKKYSKSPVETKVSPFQTGTVVKTIGKIDPSEALVEPIGRQGRSV